MAADYVQLNSGVVITEAQFAEMASVRPELREIATTLDGRDITRGYVDPLALAQPQDSVLMTRAAGDYNAYRELLRDDQVAATFHQRRLAVISREWEVRPGGERRQDKAAAEFLREQLDHIRWDAVTDKMLYGVFYGHAVAECLWARDGRQVVLDAVRVRDRKRFGFDGRGDLKLLTMAKPDGEVLPERKFWFFQTGADHDDDPYGMGLAHWLYWPVFFKRNGIKFWLIFLEKFGQPTSVGRYETNATPTERAKLLQALRAITTDSGISIPQGMEIELLEAARSGTGDYTALYDHMDRAIAKVVLGQVASTEGTPGKLGNEELQQDVRLDLVKADADLVCDSFNRSVATWLTQWNYPNAATPRVWRKTEDSEDLNKVAEREKHVFDMGYKPTLRHVQDTYGGEWETIQPPPSGGPEPEPAPEFAEAARAADILPPAAQIAGRLEREAEPAMAEWLARIEAMLEAADSLEEFREMLLTAYADLPEAPLAGVLGDALEVAEAAGRFDVEQTGA
ncbi:DUF935 domain-containing protein [Sedimenticola hydrogenitrophicus]|uniref:DUF935 domain-containing protein n=1 Tax=Sedimenticola hydrogenitrophicus TaxID=2967975 RepID=UPI0023B20502|nr:DUF935 family protein [Sedimenticola hydrogenitrophicus]